jgi:haloalkane dehalogenase
MGLSARPDQGADWSRLERRIEDLCGLVEHLDLRDLTVVVHDWGGAIGLGMAGRMPERIAGLVITNTGIPPFFIKPILLRTAVGNLAIPGFLFMSTGFMAPPSLNFLPLSAVKKCSPTEDLIPTFLAKAGLLAIAAIKLCCFLLVLGII